MIKLVEYAPGKWRVKRPELRLSHSSLPRPYVISDTMDPVEQVDGKFYTSKSRFRAVGKSLGLIEVGNSKLEPKQRSASGPEHERKVRDTLCKVVSEYKQGRRPKV